LNESICILAVEPAPDILSGTALVLERAGYVVTRASNGQDALRAARENRPDVVVLNRTLPDMDGMDICQQLKQEPDLANILVILVSGENLESEEQGKGFESGADDYIVRPVGEREFLARVQACVRIIRLTRSLRVQQENQKAIFASSPFGMLLFDEETKIVDSNAAISRMLSRDPAKINLHRGGAGLGCTHSFEDERGCGYAAACPMCPLRRGILRVLSSGTSVHGAEMQLTTLSNGQEHRRWLSVSAESVLIDGRKHVLVAIDDITERKREQESLRTSEARLRAVLDASPFPCAIVDLPGSNVLYWTRSALALFGHTVRSTDEWYQVAYPDPVYRSEVIERWKPFLEPPSGPQETVNTGEYRITCSDGSVRICEIYASFISDALIVTFNDITDRKRTEDELKQSTALTEAVVDNAPLMIFLKEATDLRFVMINRAGEELFGHERKNLLGKQDKDLFPDEQVAFFVAKDRAVLDGETGILDIPEEPIMTANKGQRLLHTRKVCIKWGDGTTKYLLGISTVRSHWAKKDCNALQQVGNWALSGWFVCFHKWGTGGSGTSWTLDDRHGHQCPNRFYGIH
jgi:PAS domain S-box-containing protein